MLGAKVLLAVMVSAAVPSLAAERVIAYLNEDGPRVRLALERLSAALKEKGVSARHDFRIEHVVIDHTDIAGIRAAASGAVDRGAAILIATSSIAAEGTHSVTARVPILFASHQEPVAYGLVAAVREPGSNMTGYTFYQPVEMKRVEMLREIAPGIRKLGVLTDASWYRDPASKGFTADLMRRYGITAEMFPCETPAALQAALASPKAKAMDAWYIPTTALTFAQPALIAQAIGNLRKPAVYSLSMHAANGGLLAYQPDLEDPNETWAVMLGMLLDGVPPAEIPIERPKVFKLEVNLRTAAEQGIAIPKTLLHRATRIHRQ